MNYQNCVNLSMNVNELKRVASAYVEDCRKLDLNELKTSLMKTEGQYTSYENVEKQLNSLKSHIKFVNNFTANVFKSEFTVFKNDISIIYKMFYRGTSHTSVSTCNNSVFHKKSFIC